jgi:L-rhamnose mutarotase
MKRYGMMVGLKSEAFDEYKRYHEAVWPEVLATIGRCNIRNYTIYHSQGLLFASYEYHGTDHAADMAMMGEDPATQRWWAIMNPMQTPLDGTPAGAWWRPMEEMFHFDGPAGTETEKSEDFLAG